MRPLLWQPLDYRNRGDRLGELSLMLRERRPLLLTVFLGVEKVEHRAELFPLQGRAQLDALVADSKQLLL